MPRDVMITPLTLYNLDNTIFDGIVLPEYHFPRSIEYDDLFLKEGWSLNRETLINNLLLETAELNTLYTNPEFFKFAVTQWSHKEFPVWQSLYETLFYKYNPIWNKDGTVKDSEKQIRNLTLSNTRTKSNNNVNVNNEQETISDMEGITDINVISDSDVIKDTLTHEGEKNTVKNTNTDKTFDGTSTNSVSAFDEMTAFSNKDKNVSNNADITVQDEVNIENESIGEDTNKDREYTRNQNNIIDRSNDKNRNTVNNNVQSGSEQESTNSTDGGNVTTEKDERDYGNIGLTTTQSLIEAERKLVQFNIYNLIIDSFIARFCLLVY